MDLADAYRFGPPAPDVSVATLRAHSYPTSITFLAVSFIHVLRVWG
jgi:hypothetical protein